VEQIRIAAARDLHAGQFLEKIETAMALPDLAAIHFRMAWPRSGSLQAEWGG